MRGRLARTLVPGLLLLAACSSVGAPVSTAGEPLPAPGPTRASPSTKAPWLAFGDSITQDAFAAALDAWNAAWPDGAPPVINAGIRGADSAYGLVRLDEFLAANPNAVGVGLAFGTNDVGHQRTPDAFRGSLVALIQRVEDDGKRPLVARIPYSRAPAYQSIPLFDGVIDQVVQAQHLPAGPDLYNWFAAHPDQIGPDGVHMTAAGDQAIQRLWAAAAVAAGF